MLAKEDIHTELFLYSKRLRYIYTAESILEQPAVELLMRLTVVDVAKKEKRKLDPAVEPLIFL